MVHPELSDVRRIGLKQAPRHISLITETVGEKKQPHWAGWAEAPWLENQVGPEGERETPQTWTAI